MSAASPLLFLLPAVSVDDHQRFALSFISLVGRHHILSVLICWYKDQVVLIETVRWKPRNFGRHTRAETLDYLHPNGKMVRRGILLPGKRLIGQARSGGQSCSWPL